MLTWVKARGLALERGWGCSSSRHRQESAVLLQKSAEILAAMCWREAAALAATHQNSSLALCKNGNVLLNACRQPNACMLFKLSRLQPAQHNTNFAPKYWRGARTWFR